MTDHRKWIPPSEEDSIFGFGIQDEPRVKPALPKQDRDYWNKIAHSKPKPKLHDPSKMRTPPIELYATLGTGVIMWTVLVFTVLIIIAVGIKLLRWIIGA